MKYFVKSLITFIVLIFPFLINAKVKVIGELPEGEVLFNKLKNFPKKFAGNKEYFNKDYKDQINELKTVYNYTKDNDIKLYTAHRLWLDPIYNTLFNVKNNFNTDVSDLSTFSKSDAEMILKPILKSAYDFDLDKNLLRYFPQHLNYDFETKITDTNKFYSEPYCQETYQAAKKVFDLAKGNMLLVVGQTPAYIGIMVEELNKNAQPEDKINIQYIPFSGRPDLIRFFEWADNMHNYSVKDILTKEHEEYFKELLKSKNFSPQYFQNNSAKKVFFLDNTTGTTLAQFLLISARWFKEHKIDLPDITLINMRTDNKSVSELDLTINKNCSFQIDSHYLNMKEAVLKDFDKVTNNLRIMPPYPCLYWNKDSDTLFKKYPQDDAKKLSEFYKKYVVLKNLTGKNCLPLNYWRNPIAIKLLKEGKVISMKPMREHLKERGKGAIFGGKVFLVTLHNGLKAVFKPTDLYNPLWEAFKHMEKEFLGETYCEIAAYEASKFLGFPNIPPTIMTEIDGKKGSLQLYVETDIDAIAEGVYKQALTEIDVE